LDNSAIYANRLRESRQFVTEWLRNFKLTCAAIPTISRYVNAFWTIQQRFKLGTKTMFNTIAVGIVLLDGWGMVCNRMAQELQAHLCSNTNNKQVCQFQGIIRNDAMC
jgi:hypothetical protein